MLALGTHVFDWPVQVPYIIAYLSGQAEKSALSRLSTEDSVLQLGIIAQGADL